MIKTVNELKELLTWAKNEGIKTIEVGDIKAEFSDLALTMNLLPESVSELQGNSKPSKEISSKNTELMTDGSLLSPEEEEELLFHSSR